MIYCIVILVVATYLVLQLPVFGANPKGERLQRIKDSKQYIKGKLNYPNKPINVGQMKDGLKFLRLFLKNVEDKVPSKTISTIKPNFGNNTTSEIEFTWFGHSSYLIQLDNKNILVDPVFSKRASPFQFMGPKAFEGTDFIQVEDLPELDIVLITHDHYDHLDYKTIKQLKATSFITSLGVGAHLERWGIASEMIIELDWFEKITIDSFEFTALPARHFTGRGITNRFSTLWSSFALKTMSKNIFIGGDSGYGDHFKEIGNKYGPFDLTFMETGQYNTLWADIHSLPEDAVQAHLDLKGEVMMPVHWAKFPLAYHSWTEPIERVKIKANELNVSFITPRLGEHVTLKSLPKETWWEE